MGYIGDMTDSTEQMELPLEFDAPDHYLVTLWSGVLHDEREVRSSKAHSRIDAEAFIEAFRESCALRDGVVWDGDAVNRSGELSGLRSTEGGAISYRITVVPTLSTKLAETD